MKYINLHTHQFTGQDEILEVVNQYPDEFKESIPFYSVGIHPWRIVQERIASDLSILESKLMLNNCLAVGECGLDKRIDTPLEIQFPVFEKQLLLAQKYRKPVIIHCVAAFQEIIETRKRLNISVPMIIHGFSKNGQVAQSLIDNGFYISFGKYLLRNPELRVVFQKISNDRFFLETDTIQEEIQEVYDFAASCKNTDVESLKHNIITSYKTVFGNFD